jgi:hypothetical protein
MRRWYTNIGTSHIHIADRLSDEEVDRIIYVAYCKIRDADRLTSNDLTSTLERLESNREVELDAAADYFKAQIKDRDDE